MDKSKFGLAPIFNCDSKVLILGSFPSIISRKQDFYYANPRNRFWHVMAQIFDSDSGNTNQEKTKFLLENNIALWDVIKSCKLKGSSDNDIKLSNSVANDLKVILDKADIKLIICNGKKSYQMFNIFNKNIAIDCVCLPSTSPANVRFDISQWHSVFYDFYNKFK